MNRRPPTDKSGDGLALVAYPGLVFTLSDQFRPRGRATERTRITGRAEIGDGVPLVVVPPAAPPDSARPRRSQTP